MQRLLRTVIPWALTLFCGFASLADAHPANGQHPPECIDHRPNIVLFLVDDLGWQDLSVPLWSERTRWNDHFQTPNVQRLADRGVRFTQAYASCVCSPTRSSIMTGQNAARHRVTNWTLHPDKDQSGRTSRLGPPRGWRLEGIQPSDPTLVSVLRDAGYHTVHCGKAHWGATGTLGSNPLELGFDVNIAGHAAGAPGSYRGTENFGNDPGADWTPPCGVPGLQQYHGSDIFLTDALVDQACTALERATGTATEKPFFLYMAPYAVHAPIQEHPNWIANFRGRNFPGSTIAIAEPEAAYASMVQGVDAALGRLIDKLRQLGVAERTLVLFTSDNGALSVHSRGETPYGNGPNSHCWPLRGGKGSAYEGGTRVPLIIGWAAVDPASPLQQAWPIAGGSGCDVPVISEDLFPTICHWAGVDRLPRSACDGQDFGGAVAGRQPAPTRPLVFHYPHVWGPAGDGYHPHSALRLGDWKAIYFYHSHRWELYQLRKDIGETDNLAFTRPEKLQQMASTLVEQLDMFDAQMPTVLASGRPTKILPPVFHSAAMPVASSEQRAAAAGWLNGGNWLDQHRQINQLAAAQKPRLVFLGDSITQSWGGDGRTVAQVGGGTWNEFYARRNAANFGISGDRTENVLWRIDHGNFDSIQPAVIVLMIGTNNVDHNSADQIADGIQRIVLRLEEKCPGSRILLLGAFPRGLPDSPARKKLAAVNQRIQTLGQVGAGGAKVVATRFLDISRHFLLANGELNLDLFAEDQLHLSADGYRAWAEAIEPLLQELLPAR